MLKYRGIYIGYTTPTHSDAWARNINKKPRLRKNQKKKIENTCWRRLSDQLYLESSSGVWQSLLRSANLKPLSLYSYLIIETLGRIAAAIPW